MRVIAERENAYSIRFKGPGHNHQISDYTQTFTKSSILSHVKSEILDDKSKIIEKSHMELYSDME